MTCIDCIYYTDELGRHIKGCFLMPYKITLPDDEACGKLIPCEEKQ